MLRVTLLSTCLFWTLSLAPGLALVERVRPRALEAGALSAIAYGYPASLGVLAPVAITCYWLRLPVAVLSTWWLITATVGLGALVRARMGRSWRPNPRLDVGVAAALLFVHLVMQARVGAWLDGDATFHLGRVRHVLDHGFDNRDFYLRGESFTRIYHTNLIHALFAVATQLTRGDLLEVWWASLAWAKLVIAGAHFALGHALFRRREPAWLLALVVSAVQAGMTYAVYPNALAAGWLVPWLWAIALDHLESPRGAPALLAAGSFLLSLVHPLYALFAMFVIGPGVAIAALTSLRGDRVRARGLAWMLAALLAGAPAGLVARHANAFLPATAPHAPVQVQAPAERDRPSVDAIRTAAPRKPPTPALAAGGGPLEKTLEQRPDGRRWLPPAKTGGVALVLAGFVALFVVGARRTTEGARARHLLLAASSCAALLYWPWLCTLAADSFGLAAALPRLVPLLGTALFAGLVGATELALDWLPQHRLTWPVATVVAVALATRLFGFSPQSFDEHWHDALAPVSANHGMLALQRARRTALRAWIPAGETVLASPREGRYVAMLHDVTVLVVDRGHGTTRGLAERREAVERMTAKRTPWAERAELLRKHRLRFLVFRDKWRDRYGWAYEHGRVLGQGGDFHVIALTPDA